MEYSLTALIDKDFDVDEVLGNISNYIKECNGKVIKESFDSNAKLAYPIKMKFECVRYCLKLSFDNVKDAHRCSNKMNYDKGILRYLLWLD